MLSSFNASSSSSTTTTHSFSFSGCPPPPITGSASFLLWNQAMNVVGGNQGRSLQALYDLGIAAKPAYAYDKSKAHMLVTATGRDRIGRHALHEGRTHVWRSCSVVGACLGRPACLCLVSLLAAASRL